MTAPTAPLVSVVVRSHERRFLVDRALASVIGQSHTAWELLVVDDGSTDGTAAWLRSAYGDEPRLTVLQEPHRGAAAAGNRGLAAARGSHVAFLDSDDEWTPHFLEAQLAALEQAPEAVASACDFVQVWDQAALERVVKLALPEAQRRGMLRGVFVPCLSLVLFRRAALQELGGFDPALRVAHDRDLLLRCALRWETPFTHLPLPLARRHLHGGNLINDVGRWRAEGLAALARAFADAAAAPHRDLMAAAEAGFLRRVEAYGAQRQALAAAPTRPISVVIATRDRQPLLAKALDAVDAQLYRPAELIVVDDGSTDGTPDWLRGLGRADLQLIETGGGRGVAHARNLGNRAAGGEIIAALDDDDLWFPDYLGAVARAFDLAPAPIFSYADYFYRRSEDGPLARVRHDPPTAFADLVLRLFDGCFPASSTLFGCAKASLDAVGGYDEGLERSEDLDLYARLLLHQVAPPDEAQFTHTPAYIPRPLALRLLHNRGRDAIATARLAKACLDRMLDKFLASDPGTPYREIGAELRHRAQGRMDQFYHAIFSLTLDQAAEGSPR